jgi:uncharacterized damage-inducible protein DinB
MQQQKALNNVFVQLAESLEQLSADQYGQHCSSLFNHTIGQHVRHIIEFFQCLEKGYEEGTVNYKDRKRDIEIETDKILAGKLLNEIFANLDKSNKNLQLEACYDDQSTQTIFIETNYYREIAYNLEHTIHHMALIRIGIKEVGPVSISEDFGVASSTLKHRRQCVQ